MPVTSLVLTGNLKSDMKVVNLSFGISFSTHARNSREAVDSKSGLTIISE
jgi:hypothetical protein